MKIVFILFFFSKIPTYFSLHVEACDCLDLRLQKKKLCLVSVYIPTTFSAFVEPAWKRKEVQLRCEAGSTDVETVPGG